MSRPTVPSTPAAGPLYLTAADLEAMLERSVRAADASGCRHVTVEHGDLETVDDVDRLEQLRRFAWETGALVATRGGNDYTTWILRPGAAEAQGRLLARVAELAPSWWRWSTEPLPTFGRAR